jgi:hypothetical protein
MLLLMLLRFLVSALCRQAQMIQPQVIGMLNALKCSSLSGPVSVNQHTSTNGNAIHCIDMLSVGRM